MKFFIKSLPSISKQKKFLCTTSENVKKGDLVYLDYCDQFGFVLSTSPSGIVRLKFDDVYWTDGLASSFKVISELSANNIEEGDKVVIEITDGYKPTGDLIIGTLTRKWAKEPYCEIDEKSIDLASEGHSSNIYKILNTIENNF